MDNQKELGFSIKILGTDVQLTELAKIEAKLRESAKARKFANDTIKQGELLQKQLNKELKEGTITEAEYNAATKSLQNTNKEANNTLAASILATKDLNKDKRVLTNTIQNENKVANEQATSYNSLSAQYSLMKTKINQMTKAERENTVAGQKLVADSKKIYEEMKRMQEVTGKTSLNVGNYGEAMRGASGILGQYGGQLGRTINQLVSLNSQVKGIAASLKAQEAATAATTAATSGTSKALKVLRIALISTGIGAIVVALGALVGGFLSTQRGADAVTKVLRPLQAVLSKVVGFVQNTAIATFDRFKAALKDPKQAIIDLGKAIIENIVNRFKAFQVFAQGFRDLFDGNFGAAAKSFGNATLQMATGVENAADKMLAAGKKSADFIKESVEQGKQLDALQKQIERTDIERIKRTSELNRIAKENNKIAQDQSKSTAERLTAIKKAEAAEQQRVALEVKYHNLRVKQKNLENALNDTSRDDSKDLVLIEQEREQALAKSADLQARYQNQRNSITKQAIALTKQEQKAVESLAIENLKLARTVRDNKLALQSDSIGKSMDMLMNQYEDEYKLLEKSLVSQEEIDKAKGVSKDSLIQKNMLINERLLQLDEKLSSDSRKLIVDNDKKTNDLRLKELDQHQTLEELSVRNKVINNLLTEEEGEKALLELKKSYLQEKLALIDTETEEGKIKYQELVNEIDRLNNPESGEKTGLADLLDISDEEAQRIKNAALSLASNISREIADHNAQQRAIETDKSIAASESERDKRIADNQELLDKGLISKELFDKKNLELDQEYQEKVAQLKKEEFIKNKKASVVTATLDATLGVIKALAQGGPVAAAIAAVFGAVQVAKVASTPIPEFATGGRVTNSMINIPTKPNGDNVHATLKAGEVVLNEGHQRALGGASTFAAIGVPGFANGGIVGNNPPPLTSRAIGQTKIEAKLDERQLMSIVGMIDTKINNLRVSEFEVSDTQSTVSTIELENTY